MFNRSLFGTGMLGAAIAFAMSVAPIVPMIEDKPRGPGRDTHRLKAANTYSPNGQRECERRKRQSAKIAARSQLA